MNVVVIENLLRKVVREELERLVAAGGAVDLCAPVVPAVREVGRHPFDLTEREIKSAAAFLDDDEEKALRHRVTGYRLEKAGHVRQARAHSRKADSLERHRAAAKSGC